MNWILVFLGGGLGSLLRYGTSVLTARFWHHAFPLATLLSNVIACIILGITVALLREKLQSHEAWYTFMVVGICGGYSTFSTFAKDNLDLFDKGNVGMAALNIAVSVALCIVAVYLGRKVA